MNIRKKKIKDSRAVKITVMDNGEEIGRVRLYVLFNELHEEPFGFMEDLFVSEKSRGKGVGEKLVTEAVAEAKKNNCYKFIFTCSHPELFGWYEKLGFEKRSAGFRMDFKK
ncbi:MAG: GNAT family N-acetyltransferase [Patescibacteria group bacterium]